MKTATFSHFSACCLVFLFVTNTQAAVSITTRLQPTPGLPGFQTVTVTATSTVPGESFVAVDFYGNPDDNNPATAGGFFGPMNQVLLMGQPTVFDIPSPFAVIDPPPVPLQQDSHFLVGQWVQTGIDIIVPAGFASESTNSLRTVYAATDPIGESIAIAQLVIPEAANGAVNYRGRFAVMRGGVPVDTEEVSGVIVAVPEPATWLFVLTAIVAFRIQHTRGLAS